MDPVLSSTHFTRNSAHLFSQTVSIFFGVVAITFGIGAFAFADPAAVPVFGLAFAAAGFLRESRGGKRKAVFILLGAGTSISAVAMLRSFHVF